MPELLVTAPVIHLIGVPSEFLTVETRLISLLTQIRRASKCRYIQHL